MWHICNLNRPVADSYALRMAKLRIEEVLNKKKLSKRKFYQMLKTDSGTGSRYFRPDFNPTFLTLEKIAKVLGVRIRDLIKE